MKPTTDHVLICHAGPEGVAMRCEHCTLEYIPSFPMPLERYAEQARGFALMHRRCAKAEVPSRQLDLPHHQYAIGDRVTDGTGAPFPDVTYEGEGDDMETEDECSARAVREEMGIDGMSDEPDPETDPPERDADGAPLPPPAYPQFVIDQELEARFARLCPVAKDGARLHSDLAIALQRHEGAVLPSLATIDGFHPSTIVFQEIARWVCFELADMNRREHPEFDCFLPLERQPMPERLAALVMPPAKKNEQRARRLLPARPVQ